MPIVVLWNVRRLKLGRPIRIRLSTILRLRPYGLTSVLTWGSTLTSGRKNGLAPIPGDAFPTIRNMVEVDGMECPSVCLALTISRLVMEGRGLLGLLIISLRVWLKLLLLNVNNESLVPVACTSLSSWLCVDGLRLDSADFGVGRVSQLQSCRRDKWSTNRVGNTGMILGVLLVPSWCRSAPFRSADMTRRSSLILTLMIGPLSLSSNAICMESRGIAPPKTNVVRLPIPWRWL